MKKNKFIQYFLYDKLWKLKNLISISQLEFDFMTYPTQQNLLSLLIGFHHVINNRVETTLDFVKQKDSLKV